jgi:RNA polymerase sigma-70 factor (ECF subfamily)
MQRIAAADVEAYNQLVAAHLRSVHGFAYRLLGQRQEAEEVTQETFLRAWQRAASYEPRARISTWLFSICHNLAVDRLRKRREHANPHLVDLAPDSGEPGRLLERKRTAEAVQKALDELAPRQKAAITLVHYQGMSNPEVAEVLGVGVEAVESLLARGRRSLRKALKNQLGGTSHERGAESAKEST